MCIYNVFELERKRAPLCACAHSHKSSFCVTSKDETIDGIPHALHVAKEVSPFGKGVGEVREAPALRIRV